MLRRQVIGLAAIATALLVVTLGCSGSSGGGRPGQPLDATFKRFDGTTGTLAEYRGKPMVINFFSSTCIPCQSEMPALEHVKQSLGDKVTFLGMDVQDTVDGGKAFIDTVGITWELGRDPNADILQGVVKGIALPTTVVLDRDGRMVFSHLGAVDVAGLTGVLRDHKLIS